MPREMDTSAHEDRGSSWQELVGRIAVGDESALSALYDETRSLVYGVVLRIVSMPAVAEEVSMDVYLQVWRQASRYQQGRGSVFTWLMLLARSRALDRLRRERVEAAYTWESFADGFDLADSGRGPESFVQARQAHARMSQILQELPDAQRQVIELSFYEGMSHIEVAEQLQLPLGTVKSRIRSAIGKFREAVT
jgi:RNA polymerase sigma-70 factor, ECF subfamily